MSEKPTLSWKDLLDSGDACMPPRGDHDSVPDPEIFSRHAEQSRHTLVVGRKNVNGETSREFDGARPNNAWFIGLNMTF